MKASCCVQQDIDLFSSDAFGGKDLIFSDSATGLVVLPKSTDSFLYLKQDYYEAMRALKGDTIILKIHVNVYSECTHINMH